MYPIFPIKFFQLLRGDAICLWAGIVSPRRPLMDLLLPCPQDEIPPIPRHPVFNNGRRPRRPGQYLRRHSIDPKKPTFSPSNIYPLLPPLFFIKTINILVLFIILFLSSVNKNLCIFFSFSDAHISTSTLYIFIPFLSSVHIIL